MVSPALVQKMFVFAAETMSHDFFYLFLLEIIFFNVFGLF
jgi:hypothetical protein